MGKMMKGCLTVFLFLVFVGIVSSFITTRMMADKATSSNIEKSVDKDTGKDKKPKTESYEFSPEQISFLKSIGIKQIGEVTKENEKCEFDYNGEKVVVILNEKHGIKTVLVSGNTYWSDKNGKTGILAEDKQKIVDNFIANHNSQYDQANQITWVDSHYSDFNHKGVMLYMGIDGKKNTDPKFIRVKLHYSDEDWVFFDRVIFSNTEKSWTYQASSRLAPKHDVVSGGIHETLDVPIQDVLPGLEIITNGDNPRIDFVGKYKDGVVVNNTELNRIREYIRLYNAIK